MAAKLDSIAVELAAIIGDYLDVASLCTLRLVSKPIKEIFTPNFRQYLQHQNADLTNSSLERLCELAANKEFNFAVRNLNVTCLYFLGEDTTDNENQTWLAERKVEQHQFTGQRMCTMLTKALSGLPNLRNINLDASIATNPNYRLRIDAVRSFAWKEQWRRAFQAYQTLLAAIAYSGTEIEGLSIFQPQRMRKCSLPIHEIDMSLAHRLEKEGFGKVGTRLKRFSISLAMTTAPKNLNEPQNQPSESNALATNHDTTPSKADFEGILSLLQLMPNLEALHLYFYPSIDNTNPLSTHHSFLPALLHNFHFPHLKELDLLGLRAPQSAFETLICLHTTTLQLLTLTNIVLTTGTWRPIFTLLSQAPSLTTLSLCLLGLGENRTTVNLEPEDKDLNPHEEGKKLEAYYLGHEYFWHTRCIYQEEIRRGLRFRSVRSRDEMRDRREISLLGLFHSSYVLYCRCC